MSMDVTDPSPCSSSSSLESEVVDRGVKININSNLAKLRQGEDEINELYFLQAASLVSRKGVDGASKLIQSFPRYVRNTDITRFLVAYECFKKILNVHGSICEVGLLHGNCTFSMAHLSEIFEPRNYLREVIGFDTFSGHTMEFHDKDNLSASALQEFSTFSKDSVSTLSDLEESVDIFEKNKFLSQFQKIRLVEGDAAKTIPAFVAENPGLVVSMIILGTDIYSPSVAAMKYLYPLMPKGGLVLVTAAGYNYNPGETQAIMDSVGIENIELKRFDFATKWSYFIKG